jgi:hypothetical protein
MDVFKIFYLFVFRPIVSQLTKIKIFELSVLLIFYTDEVKNQRNPQDSLNVPTVEYAKVFCHVAQIIFPIALFSFWNGN